MPKVPLLDLKREPPELTARLQAAWQRVYASGQFILGPEVAAFEAEMAAYLGVGHAIGVSSGTDALLMALLALEIGPGDEVVVPAFTFFATAGCVQRVGARPVFADIDPRSFNVSAETLVAVITPRTRALAPVHLFGQCAEMAAILDLARAKGLPVIEDAAQAVGSTQGRLKAGALGTIGCLSFFPTKNLGALGDGGLVTTHDDALAATLRCLRNHGQEPKYIHPRVGGNFRLDALQAAFLRERLPYLDGWSRARAANAARYRGLFAEAKIGAEQVELPEELSGRGHTWNQFVVRVRARGAGVNRQRDGLKAHLLENGIGCEVYYPSPLHLQPCFEALGGRKGDCPYAEAAAEEALALPIFPGLREDEQAAVVAEIGRFLKAV